MKELRFEDLYSPEYYWEIPEHESRIAIMKFIDARDTMGMARLSLSYIDDESTNDLTKNFVRTIHLRHAIEDLNNSFDLLMQIPWFYYRIWEKYNSGGSLRTRELKNYDDITKNTPEWVHIAERACSKEKVVVYLNSITNSVEQKITGFYNSYVKNATKPFTVRTLCNAMKHNHALAFEELYDPYEFNVNINGEVLNLKENGMRLEFHQDIAELSNPESIVGRIHYECDNDLSVEIEYTNGELFRFKDCTHEGNRLKISEVYEECCKYFDALVDLFEDIYNDIYPQMRLLESFVGNDGKPNIKASSDKIDLNNYFSVS